MTVCSVRPPTRSAKPAVTAPLITYGDHGLWPDKPDYYGIDDFTEIWWDPTATGKDEIRREGTGMMQFVDGGKRYRLGEWTSDTKVFDKDGAVVIYDQLPAVGDAAELSAAAGLTGRGRRLRSRDVSGELAGSHHTQRVARCANSSSRSMTAKARCGTTSHIEWLVTKVTISACFTGSGSYFAA